MIVSAVSTLDKSSKIWGTGGWLPPEEREDLDWFMLVYFMGWSAVVHDLNDLDLNLMHKGRFKWIIFTSLTESIDSSKLNELIATAAGKGMNIIVRPGNMSVEILDKFKLTSVNERRTGQRVRWQGPGIQKKWKCTELFSFYPIQSTGNEEVWATIDNYPLIISKTIGENSHLVLLGFHPSKAQDQDGIFSSLLRNLLIFGIETPVVWIDWRGIMLLRMDDPGSSETVHHNIYSDVNKLKLQQWRSIGQILKKHNAKLNIGYVSGWVDDGNEARGFLKVDNVDVERHAGSIYPSPSIKYIRNRGGVEVPYDYQEEYLGIQSLLNENLIDVAVHGYTHIFPNYRRWLAAPDCYDSNHWYREFGADAIDYIDRRVKNGSNHPLEKAVDSITKYFNVPTITLINPGEKFTNSIQKKALDLGFKLISSYYTALRVEGKFCWTQHVCAPYLDRAATRWFDAEFPVIGYFHDFDISRFGSRWLDNNLQEWKKAGALCFFDFTTFRALLDLKFHLKREEGHYVLEIKNEQDIELKNPVKIGMKFTSGESVKHVTLRCKQEDVDITPHQLEGQLAYIQLNNLNLNDYNQ